MRRQGVVFGQELAVLASEDIVGHGGDGEAGPESFAEGEHEGRLSRADWAATISTSIAADESNFDDCNWVPSLHGRLQVQVAATYPPMPIVKDLSSQSLPSIIGISRPRKLPGPSRISCVCP